MLRAWALDGAPAGALVLADRQRAGRGRQGREWRDLGAGNLLVSVLLRHDGPIEHLPAFSPLVAWTLRESLGGDPELGLKWPNDLWLAGRKVAGILLESMGDRDTAILVGVGLNLREPPAGWGELEGAATSLEAAGRLLRPTDVLRSWLPVLDATWERFVVDGMRPYLDVWNASAVLNDRTVRWLEDGVLHRGTARAMALDGSLEVSGPGEGCKYIHAADVHLEGSS